MQDKKSIRVCILDSDAIRRDTNKYLSNINFDDFIFFFTFVCIPGYEFMFNACIRIPRGNLTRKWIHNKNDLVFSCFILLHLILDIIQLFTRHTTKLYECDICLQTMDERRLNCPDRAAVYDVQRSSEYLSHSHYKMLRRFGDVNAELGRDFDLTYLIAFNGAHFTGVSCIDFAQEVNTIIVNVESFYEFIIGNATMWRLAVDSDFIIEFSSTKNTNARTNNCHNHH